MLSFEAISTQCNFIEQYLKPYLSTSVVKTHHTPIDIRLESLPNVIARFSNKNSCKQIDSADVANFTVMFKYCSEVYKKVASFNLMSMPTLEQVEHLKLASICRDKNLIDSYNYLIDKYNYFKSNPNDELKTNKLEFEINAKAETPVVKYTSIYISVKKTDKNFLLKFYLNFLKPHFINRPIELLNEHETSKMYEIVGLNFDIKQELFSEYLRSSLTLIILSSVCVSILAMLYLKSTSLYLGTLICIGFSSLEAYFVFKIIFKIDTFSFLSLSSIILLTGVTLTSVFLLSDAWSQAKLKNKSVLFDPKPEYFNQSTGLQLKSKLENLKSILDENKNSFDIETNLSYNQKDIYTNNPMFGIYLENCVKFTFKRVLGTIFTYMIIILGSCLILVFSSSILAVKTIGLFTLLSILFNFFLIISIIPSILVLKTKHFYKLKKTFASKCAQIEKISKPVENFLISLKFVYHKMFESYLPCFITSYKYVLISVSLLVGFSSFIFIFYKPGLILTTSDKHQLFSLKNPLVYYDEQFSNTSYTNGIFMYQEERLRNLQVNYVFGIKIKETKGFSFRSLDTNDIEFGEEDFDFYDAKSQLWFSQFCKSLQLFPSVRQNEISEARSDKSLNVVENMILMEKNENKNLCLIDLLKIVFSRKCAPESDDLTEASCCEQTLPFDPNVLEACLKNRNFLELYIAPYQGLLTEKLYFNKSNGQISVIEFQQITDYEWTSAYSNMTLIYSEIESFFKKQSKLKFIDLANLGNTRKSFEKFSFFHSNFDFYDLQKSIFNGTVISIPVSLLIAFLIILINNRNLFLSLISLATIVFSLSTTTGLMTLLGIKLGITESLAINLSNYLTVYFVVCMSSNYSRILMARQKNELEFTTMFFVRDKTIEMLMDQCGSSVFMACLALAFGFMGLIPSYLYSFQTIALFFIFSLIFSLFFLHFFFLPFCLLCPSRNHCEFNGKETRSSENFQQNNQSVFATSF